MPSVDEPHYRDWDPLLPPSGLIFGPLLVVAPHPDDEVIGAGGLIAAHRRAGESVDILILTDGALGVPGTEGDDAYRDARRAEAHEAAERLGGANLHFSCHRDGNLRSVVDDATLRGLMDRTPRCVAFPSPFELHPDHRAASLLVARTLAQLAHPPGELLLYEVGVPTLANVLMDVTQLMDQKVHALAAYRSQLIHHDLLTKVRHLNAMRTVNVADPSLAYAEAFTRLTPPGVASWFSAVNGISRLLDRSRPGARDANSRKFGPADDELS